MNNIEETLWNYIDGNCTPAEQNAINKLIEQDAVYRLKYQELLNLNQEFTYIELDEPPMAFTYNVMESIRAEHAQKPLKATINKRIIMGITIFFVFTILGLLVFTLSNISWSADGSYIKFPSSLKLPDMRSLSKPILQGFLFFDVILALFLFDTFLRHRKISRHI